MLKCQAEKGIFVISFGSIHIYFSVFSASWLDAFHASLPPFVFFQRYNLLLVVWQWVQKRFREQGKGNSVFLIVDEITYSSNVSFLSSRQRMNTQTILLFSPKENLEQVGIGLISGIRSSFQFIALPMRTSILFPRLLLNTAVLGNLSKWLLKMDTADQSNCKVFRSVLMFIDTAREDLLIGTFGISAFKT